MVGSAQRVAFVDAGVLGVAVLDAVVDVAASAVAAFDAAHRLLQHRAMRSRLWVRVRGG